MIGFPPCKINLGLHIISKRPDGYHNIETCFYPIPWTDILEVIPASENSFSTSGNFIPGDTADNLCLRAYQALKKDYPISAAKIHLHKIIPSGAGLGGGSADAAHTLRLLNQVFGLGLTNEKLMHYASSLGSDCAFFVSDVPKFGTGRGEELHDLSLNLKGKFIVIIKPDIHVSTAEAYAGVRPSIPEIGIKNILENYPLKDWSSLLRNDFEKTVFEKFPGIQKIKDVLYSKGALYASMSGSGSAVFGIFDHHVEFKEDFSKMICWSGSL
jgi:4-diphosphocytidyl-2-C-methyl-D-erythritol kinase